MYNLILGFDKYNPVLKSTKNIASVFLSKDFQKRLDAFIDIALKEDVGERDHTSFACIPAKNKAEGRLLVKSDGVIAGIEANGQIGRIRILVPLVLSR